MDEPIPDPDMKAALDSIEGPDAPDTTVGEVSADALAPPPDHIPTMFEALKAWLRRELTLHGLGHPEDDRANMNP